MESVGAAVRISLLGLFWIALNAKGKERWKMKNWIKVDENNRPADLVPCIVWGVLDGDSAPDSHEGFYNAGNEWLSVRHNWIDERPNMSIRNVTHFMPMPGSPEEEVAAIHERLAGRCRWEPRGQGWARSCDDYKGKVYAHDMPGAIFCPSCGKQIEEIKL